MDSAFITPPKGKWYGLRSLEGRLNAFVWGEGYWNLDKLFGGWTIESYTVEEFYARDMGMGIPPDFFGFKFIRLEGGANITIPD